MQFSAAEEEKVSQGPAIAILYCILTESNYDLPDFWAAKLPAQVLAIWIVRLLALANSYYDDVVLFHPFFAPRGDAAIRGEFPLPAFQAIKEDVCNKVLDMWKEIIQRGFDPLLLTTLMS